jgi:hypothetical protein
MLRLVLVVLIIQQQGLQDTDCTTRVTPYVMQQHCLEGIPALGPCPALKRLSAPAGL